MSDEFYHAARAIIYGDLDNGFSEANAMKLEAAMGDVLMDSCAGFVKEVTTGVLDLIGGGEVTGSDPYATMVYGMLVAFQREWGPVPSSYLTAGEATVLSNYHLEMIA